MIREIISAQQSLENNQHPKYITKASEVLSNHPFDKTLNQNNGNNNNNRSNENNSNNENKNNNKKINNEMVHLSFAQMDSKWYCYGKVGYKSSICSVKDKPKHK